MINTIQQLKKNHQNFDVIWNKIGTEVQTDLVKTAPELLTALGAWYNRSNELIFELEDLVQESALADSAEDILHSPDDDEEDDEWPIDDEEEEYTDFESDDSGDDPRPAVSVNI